MTTSPQSQAGKIAPKVKARLSNNLTEIIALLLSDHPEDSDAELFETFKDLTGFNTAVVRRAALFEPMIERDFLVHLHKVRPIAQGLNGITKLETKPKPKRKPIVSAEERAAMQESLTSSAAGLIRDASVRLMELRTPMGKPLSATTFGECAQLGGWYADLGAKGPADQPIGDALTEAQVRAFFDNYKGK